MSTETDAWRLADARRTCVEFIQKLYSGEESEEAINNYAIVSMGKLTATLLASDEVIAKKMAKENQG